MPTVLIIDDDQELFALLDEYLKEEGFACRHAPLPEAGLAAAREKDIDAVILDVMLPGMNGFETLRRLRADDAAGNLPVLMLTARGAEIDRVLGLEMGADDYLGKPFSPRELLARLRALLRRSAAGRTPRPETHEQTVGDLRIRKGALSVTVRGERVSLTPPEMDLLCLLTHTVGEIISRDRLCASVLGHPAYPGDRSLDMLVSRLRKKLGPHPGGGERIKAVRGQGYLFLDKGEPA